MDTSLPNEVRPGLPFCSGLFREAAAEIRGAAISIDGAWTAQ